MEDRLAALDNAVPLAKMLGYLNFSDGKADPRFQNQLNDAYQFLASAGAGEPWTELRSLLGQKLEALHTGDSGAFRNIDQARAVLTISLEQFLPAYRRHHGDLLFHFADADLFGPFFLARVFEAVLVQGSPWSEDTRILAGALDQLNDFVGHRPIAILETRPKGEPYPHERIRPIPLYLRGAGVGYGRYQDLIGPCLEILSKTDPEILAAACLDREVLEELALDPRPYDQGHPANRRPNYVFGEWDPDHIDGQGRYTRLVVRQVVLDALLDRVHQESSLDRAELIGEAAGVLTGTLLMAAGISGAGPTTHDSTTTLATLMPPIARYRDAFYANLLNGLPSPHGERLRQEAAMTRQPFGGARQHLNEFLARHRALQLQQRHLALIYAAMGFPEAGRQEAAKIPSASVRMLGEILGRLATANLEADRGQLAAAAPLLPEIEDLLQRGIACGALADPWNIIGFQGLYPLFQSRDDSVRDTRIDDLIGIVEQTLSLYTRLMSEAAALGDKGLMTQLTPAMRRFAAWWDRFASVEVQDVRHVHGGEAVQSADHVAKALGRWHEQGQAAGDLAFWKRHLEGFRSPKAFALVVEALLRKKDYRASMALLVNWLNQVEQVPLEEGSHSFHALAIRWLLEVSGDQAGPDPTGQNPPWPLVKKFFDYLEANGGDFWTVPTWESPNQSGEKTDSEEREELFSAAYENVTYRDTTDDDQEGSVMDGGAITGDFHLEAEAESMQKHLRFLGTIGQLWQIAARQPMHPDEKDSPEKEIFAPWLATARKNLRRLLEFVDAIHEYPIPEPLGSHDSMVEYDRRRSQKEQILYAAIGTCLETYLAAAAFQGALKQDPIAPEDKGLPGWENQAIRLEGALWQGNRQAVQSLLPSFLERFRSEPLLFTALADGGRPREIFRARIGQALLRNLVINLPRLGLVRETYHLLKMARRMEEVNRPEGRGVSEFNSLFQAGFTAAVSGLVEAALTWTSPALGDRELVALVEGITGPFLTLWVQHSQTLQLSSLESLPGSEWDGLRNFIMRYGSDLFHARFMTLANLRGILHRGAGNYFDYLQDNPDPLQPIRLLDDLDSAISRSQAARYMNFILRALVENYEEYKDYNTTTAQSDYGENLHMLLDFLRLRAGYDRQAWQFRPLMHVHETLARKKKNEAAGKWQEAFTQLVGDLAARNREDLARLEKLHGIRLRTITDRVQEGFVKPLDLDRLCALVAPAMEEASMSPSPAAAAASPSFHRFQQEVQQLAARPTGVGLDVPLWLRRIEVEIQTVKNKESPLVAQVEQHLRVPQKLLTFQEFQQQVQEWETPLLPP